MELLFAVLMGFVCGFCLLGVLLVSREHFNDRQSRKFNERTERDIAALEKKLDELYAKAKAPKKVKKIKKIIKVVKRPKPVPVVATEPVAEVVAEPVCEAIEEPAKTAAIEPVAEPVAEALELSEAPVAQEVKEIDENAVTFSLGEKETLEQKYLALTPEYKTYYDEIAKHAMLKEGSKRFKTDRYEEYKIGKTRLVRLTIKKGVVNCEFILYNSDFKLYISDKNVSLKHAPTTVKVTDESIVEIAKGSVDIAIKVLEEEKEYKRQQALEKRRAARAAKKAAEEGSDSTAS